MTRVHVVLYWVSVLIPNWATGQAWPHRVLLKKDTPEHWKRPLCAHELCHVLQWQRLGFWRMTIQYAFEWKKYGYHAMPLEGEARAAELDPWYLAWADHVLEHGRWP